MARLAAAQHLLVADVAAQPGDHGYGEIARNHHRPLLDVKLDIGGDRGGIEEPFAGFDALHLGAGLVHVFAERLSGIAAGQRQIVGGELAEQRVRPQIALAEPRALLAAQRHRADGALGGDPGPLHADQHQQACKHAGGAVVVAAPGHRIEMGAADHHRRVLIAAGQLDDQVGRLVEPARQPLGPGQRHAVVHGGLLARAVGLAVDADAVAVPVQPPQIVEHGVAERAQLGAAHGRFRREERFERAAHRIDSCPCNREILPRRE